MGVKISVGIMIVEIIKKDIIIGHERGERRREGERVRNMIIVTIIMISVSDIIISIIVVSSIFIFIIVIVIVIIIIVNVIVIRGVRKLF